MPYGCLPWEESFAEDFEQRNGYDLMPVLPLLALDCGARGEAARVKYDSGTRSGRKSRRIISGRFRIFAPGTISPRAAT
jgi:hypothetical protein